MAGREQDVTFKLVVKNLASGEIDKAVSGMDQLATKGGLVGSVFQGVGQQVGKMVAGLAIGVVKDFVGALGDSVKMAREEEVGIKRLDTALSANVQSYNGNREAIEKVIGEREKLAFSDGEQRDSLAKLVARTKDVNEALNLQRIAMDLARLRGMDLASAGELIGKVYGGNVGVLKRFGIQVRDGATAQEALAAIQRQSAGQAEAFANTTEGAMQSMKIAVDDVMEEIGTALIPIIKDLAVWVRDELIPAFRGFAKVIGDISDQVHHLAEAAGSEEVGKNTDAWNQVVANGQRIPPKIKVLADSVKQTVFGMMRELSKSSYDGSMDAARNFANGYHAQVPYMRRMIAASLKSPLKLGLKLAASDAFDGGGNVILKTAQGLRTNHGAVEKAMLSLKYQMLHPIDTAKEKAFLLGQLHSKELQRGLHSKDPSIRKQAEDTAALIQKALEDLAEKAREAGMTAGQLFNQSIQGQLWAAVGAAQRAARAINAALAGASGASENHAQGGGRASGGPMSAGGVYQVGENAQETVLMHPWGGATVIPGSGSRRGGGGGGDVHVHLNYAPMFSTASVSEMQRVSAMLVPELTRALRRQSVIR